MFIRHTKRCKTFDEMQLVFTNHTRDAANMARLGIAAVTAADRCVYFGRL